MSCRVRGAAPTRGRTWSRRAGRAMPRKEARLPNECGMVLRRPPVAPHATTSLIASAGPIDPVWIEIPRPGRGRLRLTGQFVN